MASRLIKEFIEDFSAFGALPFYLFLIFFFLIINETKLAYWIIIGVIFSFIFIALIKLFYFKERPKKKEYSNILEKIEASSFPSLHSWRIIMLFVLISFYYKSVYMGIFLGIVAAIVLFSRNYLKKHYWIDIVFGAIFGLIEGLVIVWFL